MKVKELMEKLAGLNPNAEVSVIDSDDSSNEAFSVEWAYEDSGEVYIKANLQLWCRGN